MWPLGARVLSSVTKLHVLEVDNHLLVVAKPAGQPSVPDASEDDSLLDAGKRFIKVEYDKPGDVFLGVVQRLDRPVSGVVCFARTSKAAARLNKAMQAGEIGKHYLALTERELGAGEGQLVQWLRKDSDTNRVASFREERPGTKRAVTDWRVAGSVAFGGRVRSLLELSPVTGRSHQLRVAAKSLGSPLLGDLKYGAAAALDDKSVALHAHRLELTHPVRRERLQFTAPLPDRAWWRASGR